MRPRFSVVVPTRNRLERLRRCLDSLAKQTFPRDRFEIIVVDDGSDDATPDWLHASPSPLGVTALRSTESSPGGARGPGVARNTGVAVARGEYIAFTEDDVVVAGTWLERADAHLAANPVDVLEGETYLEGTGRAVRRAERGAVPSFLPCNLFVRRSVFEELGGYDPSFFDPTTALYFREDADLGFRALEGGSTYARDTSIAVEHPPQFLSLTACFRHVRRYVFDPLLYRRHPRLYRKLIEAKRLFGVRVHRPLHVIALLGAAGWAGLVAGAVARSAVAMAAGGAIVVVAGQLARVKYQGRRAIRIWKLHETVAFLFLPLVYLAVLVRGCLRAGGGVRIFI